MSRKYHKTVEATNYLRKWDSKFWLSSHEQIKEIVESFDAGMRTAIGADNLASFQMGMSDKSELKKTIEHRCKEYIATAQIQELNKTYELLNEIFDDPQKKIYVIIDDLDHKWLDDSLTSNFILALMEVCGDIIKIQNVKVIVALRTDICEKVFIELKEQISQQEKLRSLFIDVTWSDRDLHELISKRINALLILPPLLKSA